MDLSRYNVIIHPDGSAAGYQRILGESGNEKLIQWVRIGGVVIGLKEGARYLTLGKENKTDVQFISEIGNPEDETVHPIEMHPGSIFKADVNSDYFLGYGYSRMIPVQVRGSRFMNPTKAGVNVVTFPSNYLLGGNQWEYT